MLNRNQVARMMNLSVVEGLKSNQNTFDCISQAKKYSLAGLVVEAYYIEYARSLLSSTPTKTIGVANYPLGGATIDSALELTRWCYDHGADEVDLTVPLSLFRSNELPILKKYLMAAAQIAEGRILKGVIWSDNMSDLEILDICNLLADCNVHYVKTNPGFRHITSVHVVPLIKNALGDTMKVVVAGGVETTEQLINFISLGADFVETSLLDSVLKDLPE